MIRIVNVRKLRTPVEMQSCVYVGRPCGMWRGTIWGNPYKVGGYGNWSVQRCLDAYRHYLTVMTPPEKLDAMLKVLWEACDQGALPLGCWCTEATHGDGSPIVCHAQILAALLVDRFGGANA